MKEKEGRIEELEEALRESVKITAEREMVMMEQKMQIDACNNKVSFIMVNLEGKTTCRIVTIYMPAIIKLVIMVTL